MKKRIAALAFAAAGVVTLPGCYLSRQVAGDDLAGGPVNPALWITVPLDTVLLPLEWSHFRAMNDGWNPWTAQAAKAEYVDQFHFEE